LKFVVTIFLSAFLLFQVQLIVAKHLLPWFGGAPAVWTTCQFFFQAVLLGGYGYAHLLSRTGDARRQRRIHLGLLLAGLLAVVIVAAISGYPVLAPESLKPKGTEPPGPLLLTILLATVGLPFLVLSATSPLLQSWHSRTAPSLDRTYRLYAVSNAGSLAGLLSYPFGVEWLLDLSGQAWLWGLLFLLFVALCAAVTWNATRFPAAATATPTAPAPQPAPRSESPAASAPHPHRAWLWLALPLLSSGLLLATTNQLCEQVATVPFLWVLPLTLYLATFIVAFDRPRFYSPRWALPAAAGTTLGILLVAHYPLEFRIPPQIAAYSLMLACACLVCHGELARLRPEAAKLTQYYLLIALGGVLGALFVSVVTPVVFSDVWEFYVLLLAAWLVWSWAWWSDQSSPWHHADRRAFATLAAIGGIFLLYHVMAWTPLAHYAWSLRKLAFVLAVSGSVFAAGAGWGAWRWPAVRSRVWVRAMAGLAVGLTSYAFYLRVQKNRANTLVVARNFFAVVRVEETRSAIGLPFVRALHHGNVLHGFQLLAAHEQRTPTSYFSASSGVGRAVRSLSADDAAGTSGAARPRHWGIVGMGAGTLAAYARPGDRVRLYEINPLVIGFSEGEKPYFTFARECAGRVTTVLGDGRLALERELAQAGEGFDLLAMDAFSGDAVPVHLITEEAFRLYAAHLRDGHSILAVNITNRFLDLEPVIAANARQLGFHAVRLKTKGDAPLPQMSDWILLSRDARVLEHPIIAEGHPAALGERQVHFTDRYSNLFRILK